VKCSGRWKMVRPFHVMLHGSVLLHGSRPGIWQILLNFSLTTTANKPHQNDHHSPLINI
jgi:hypothetical protein